jgi:hypothetical protein
MATQAADYPARIEGQLDPGLTRWLWLLKWLLVIPHFIVLAFLWIAFFFLSIVAFFAILFTARYPRGIFDFNVGVLRWTWRVGFYAFGANGTDRYPPFALGEVDYPAKLEVDYPERLSRGLVLVKWWLLAIPQYIIVGVFVGGGTWLFWSEGGDSFRYGGGLIDILVLIGVIALLFTGRYPTSIFDLVLGLNRWVVRVAAYAALMTDRYPPFRLDMGGSDQGTVALPPPAPGGGAATAEAKPLPESRGWSVGRIVLLILGSIAALIATGLLASGIAVVVVDQTQRDSAGYLVSPTRNFSTPSYAVVSRKLYAGVNGPQWVYDNLLGTIVLKSDSSKPVFLGIARAADVDRYLGRVRRATVTDLTAHRNQYVVLGTGAPSAPPGEQSFWAAQTTGSGSQSLTWDVQDGTWRVVVMNVDASSGVNADLRVGAELPNLVWFGIGLIVVGGVILAVGIFLIYLGAREHSAPPPPPGEASAPETLAT